MDRWQWQGGQGLRVASGRPTPCYVLAPAATLSAPSWGLHSRFGKVIPFIDTPPSPPSIPFSLLPVSPLSPLPPFVDTQPGGDELTQRVQTSLGVLSPPLSLCIFFFVAVANYVCSFLGNSTTSSHGGWTSAKLPCVTVQFINEDHIQIYVQHCQNK